MEWNNNSFVLTDDSSAMKPEAIRALLLQSYWAPDRTNDMIARSMKGSLNFGLFHQDCLIGFARVITDGTIFCYFCDVIIDEAFRGQGLGQWMLKCILERPGIKGTKQLLITKDAQSFYEKFGFQAKESMFRDDRINMGK